MNAAAETSPETRASALPERGTGPWRRPGARLAAWWLAVLGGLAAAAPLLASEAPLLLVSEQGIAFPAFRGMRAGDVTWLACAAAAAALAIAGFRRGPDSAPPVRRRGLVLALPAIGILAAAGALAAPGENLGVTDWAARAAAPDASAVWAPIRHGLSNVDPEGGRRYRLPGEVEGHWLGTDGAARDVAARLLFGARSALLVGFGAVALSTLVGVLLGGVAGFAGGRIDAILSWLIQVTMCFPVLLTVVALQALVASGLGTVVLLVALVRWTGPARLVRAEVARLRDAEFVLAARALGVPGPRILWRHALPHALPPVLVNAAFGVAGGILIESGLSFLGLGPPPPAASWGETMQEGFGRLSGGSHLVLLPGLLLFATVFACHTLGDAARDALDPRLEEVRR